MDTRISEVTGEKIDIERRKLKEACKQFEAIFIEYMLKTMRKTVQKSDLFKREFAEEIYSSILDQKIAEKVADSKGLGLAELLYKELEKWLPSCEKKGKKDDIEKKR